MPNPTTRPELTGTFGMVSSTHWLATAAGMAALEGGGNAFDAVVIAGFVLQVVEPHLNGPGGEVPIIGYSARDDEVFVVCGQGVAPAAASVEAYRSLGYDLVPGTGTLAACVPGAFGAWMALLERFGTASVEQVLHYAIGYARNGFPALPAVMSSIKDMRPVFERHWPSSAALWPADTPVLRNPDLADRYEEIAVDAGQQSTKDGQVDAARRAFYEGRIAATIDDFCRREQPDAMGVSQKAFLTGEDLARWRPTFEAPVRRDFRETTVFKPGPWTQGPVFLQQLALLEGFDLRSMGHNSADWIHTIVECAKLAFADREAYYGDPDFVDVPLADLLSSDYAAERRASIGEIAQEGLDPGRVAGSEPRLPQFASGGHHVGTGEPSRQHARDTCHVCVVDRHGNIVAATPSGGWLQSSPAVPGLGFPLGTRAQMFWLEEGLPNSLAPGKRPRTTLSPSLAFRDGEPWLGFGTPGGDAQDQWTLLFYLAVVEHGMDLQAAIDTPAFHSEHFPSSFFPRASRPKVVQIEGRAGTAVLDELRRRGHELEIVGDWALGRVCAVAREGEVLKAAASPRGAQAYAAGR